MKLKGRFTSLRLLINNHKAECDKPPLHRIITNSDQLRLRFQIKQEQLLNTAFLLKKYSYVS